MQKSYVRDGVSQAIEGAVLTESDISINTSLGTSNDLIPSQNAVKEYVDTNAGGVPTSRTLTINGDTKDLSANRSWTVAAGESVNEIMAYIAAY